jgi:hypothetical protein
MHIAVRALSLRPRPVCLNFDSRFHGLPLWTTTPCLWQETLGTPISQDSVLPVLAFSQVIGQSPRAACLAATKFNVDIPTTVPITVTSSIRWV